MSEMLERVGKAIQKALEKPRYVVKISKVWECWDVQENRLILASDIHAYVDEECDKGNALYAARKAVEALKTEIPNDMYEAYGTEKMWSEMTSTDVWKLWINAILSGDK